jgi:hypothetical protein
LLARIDDIDIEADNEERCGHFLGLLLNCLFSLPFSEQLGKQVKQAAGRQGTEHVAKLLFGLCFVHEWILS